MDYLQRMRKEKDAFVDALENAIQGLGAGIGEYSGRTGVAFDGAKDSLCGDVEEIANKLGGVMRDYFDGKLGDITGMQNELKRRMRKILINTYKEIVRYDEKGCDESLKSVFEKSRADTCAALDSLFSIAIEANANTSQNERKEIKDYFSSYERFETGMEVA